MLIIYAISILFLLQKNETLLNFIVEMDEILTYFFSHLFCVFFWSCGE